MAQQEIILSHTRNWVYSNISSNVKFFAGSVHRSTGAIDDKWLHRGVIQVSASDKNSNWFDSVEPHFTLTTTFQSLGLPAGKIVTQIRAGFDYKFVFSRHTRYETQGIAPSYFGDRQLGAGPFHLLNDSDQLICELAPAEWCPSRDLSKGEEMFNRYPGKGSGGKPPRPTGAGIFPNGYLVSTGSPQNVNISTGTTIKIRMYTQIPEFFPKEGQGMRVKYHRQVLTATYGDLA